MVPSPMPRLSHRHQLSSLEQLRGLLPVFLLYFGLRQPLCCCNYRLYVVTETPESGAVERVFGKYQFESDSNELR